LNKELIAKNTDKEKVIQELKNQMSELEAKFSRIDVENKQLKEKNQTLFSEIDDLKNKISELDEKSTSLSKTIEELNSQIKIV